MELDYLKSEAINANLEQPGAWEEFMGAEQLGQMVKVWNEVDFALRQLCNEAITRRITFPAAPELSQQIVTQLKRISDEVKPFNTLLGTAVSAKLLNVFEKDRADEIGDLKENVR